MMNGGDVILYQRYKFYFWKSNTIPELKEAMQSEIAAIPTTMLKIRWNDSKLEYKNALILEDVIHKEQFLKNFVMLSIKLPIFKYKMTLIL